MFVAERFLSGLVKDYGKHPVSTGGGTVSTGLPVPKTKAPHPFFCGEKSDRKDNAVQKIQN